MGVFRTQQFLIPVNGGDPRIVVSHGVWRGLEDGGSGVCSWEVGEAGDPGSSLGKGSLCLQGGNEQLA